jgi:hypothetical protein
LNRALAAFVDEEWESIRSTIKSTNEKDKAKRST